MKLLTEEQRTKLLANGTRRGPDHKPVVKWFNAGRTVHLAANSAVNLVYGVRAAYPRAHYRCCLADTGDTGPPPDG